MADGGQERRETHARRASARQDSGMDSLEPQARLTTREDQMLEIGYDVIYTKAHWDWLRSAGRALKANSRTLQIGTVVGLEEPGVVIVRWESGKPWPAKEARRKFPEHVRHLAENLETLP